MTWCWPLFGVAPEFPDAPGCFGSVRKHDVHTGVDLYAPEGSPVLAVEDGVVVAIEKFTGPSAGSPWWNDTMAVLIEGETGVVCYGEIKLATGIREASRVSRGDVVGYVLTVLSKDKGRPRSMLHIELYDMGVRASPIWLLDEERPRGLRDPTGYLHRAAFSS